MGVRKSGSIYIPNTALNTDLRTITVKPTKRVAAIFRKGKKEEKYRELTYIAKGVTVDNPILQTIINDKIDIENIYAKFEIPRLPTN